jgi:hypothetical protein
MVVAVEIQDTQTAKEALGSGAVADSVGNADAAHAAGTAAVGALKPPNQIFLKGSNFAAKKRNGQD